MRHGAGRAGGPMGGRARGCCSDAVGLAYSGVRELAEAGRAGLLWAKKKKKRKRFFF